MNHEDAAPGVRPTTGAGCNTGFEDALGVLARLLQRGQVLRDDVEDVIARNCRMGGRPVPDGGSMQRRVERLRATFELSGLPVEGLIAGGRGPGWRLAPRTWRAPAGAPPWRS